MIQPGRNTSSIHEQDIITIILRFFPQIRISHIKQHREMLQVTSDHRMINRHHLPIHPTFRERIEHHQWSCPEPERFRGWVFPICHIHKPLILSHHSKTTDWNSYISLTDV